MLVALLSPGIFSENVYSNAPTVLPLRKVVRPRMRPVYVYSFSESAFQDLPRRVVLSRQKDPVTQEVLTVPISISGIICNCARNYDLDPLIFDILTRHESGYDPSALSRAGARGLMQIMPETAVYLGITDIEDPVQNIQGGTRYLYEQLRRYGNLQLALAAYNAGPSCVDEHGGIPPFPETQGYVQSITNEYLKSRKKRNEL